MTTPRLSAVLITKNASAHLREYLAALAWADEIVVLDSGSTDDTRAICESARAHFVAAADWPGFGPQKNRAIDLARGEWILSIDADEICTPALRSAIEQAIESEAPFAAYEMSRLSSFCGHFMRHGGWWPDRVTRLWPRGRARFSDDIVHERVIVDGPVGRLDAHLVHYTYDDLEQALEKANRYSTLGAQLAYKSGKRATLISAIARGAWAFVRGYILRRGFLDGAAGYQLARYNAQTTYYRYLKLAYLSRARG